MSLSTVILDVQDALAAAMVTVLASETGATVYKGPVMVPTIVPMAYVVVNSGDRVPTDSTPTSDGYELSITVGVAVGRSGALAERRVEYLDAARLATLAALGPSAGVYMPQVTGFAFDDNNLDDRVGFAISATCRTVVNRT